jgi:hypothetical protein
MVSMAMAIRGKGEGISRGEMAGMKLVVGLAQPHLCLRDY